MRTIASIRSWLDGTHYKGAGEELVIDTLLRLLGPMVQQAQDGSATPG